jgi:hypothetical protein
MRPDLQSERHDDDDALDEALFERYLAGECSPEEADEVRRRAERSFGRPGIPEKIGDVIAEAALWERLAFRLRLPAGGAHLRDASSTHVPHRPVFTPRLLAGQRERGWSYILAAGALAVVAAGGAWWAVTAGSGSTPARGAARHITTTAAGSGR